VHPDDREFVIDCITDFRDRKTSTDFFHKIITKNGNVKVLHAKGEVQLDDKGKPVRLVGTGQDITEEYRLQQQLRELNEDLEFKNKELERSNKELSSFSYVASHDLQEPLRKIKTFGNRLMESNFTNLNETGKDSLNRMTAAAVRMQKLIEDLLAYSRTHTEDLDKEEINLNEIVKDLIENYSETYPDLNVELAKLPTIKGMKFQIIQLFDNLINNSIKYRKVKEKIKIKINCTAIKGNNLSHLGSDETINYYHIQFTDNGIGFDPLYSEKVFELFQRLQGKNEYPETGIGLSICKKIIENHEGFITAESAPGVGASFNIYLPVYQD
jgi:light-regulated signal transduction histidine kinase (bacteriophytochrome)